MNSKRLTKLSSDIEKTRDKIGELQAKLRELERMKTETENATILELVRTIDATPDELAVMLRAMQESQRQAAMQSMAPQLEDRF